MDVARVNMDRILPSVYKPPQIPEIDTSKLEPANTTFKELNANIKKIVELLENIDVTLKEMNKSQK